MTKPKVCILGNSHLAAPKLAWEQYANLPPQFEVTFFGSLANSMKFLTLNGSRLIPSDPDLKRLMTDTSNGKGDVDVNEYDVFCLIGLDFGILRAVNILQQHRLFQQRDTISRWGINLVSDACFQQALTDSLNRTVMMNTARKIIEAGGNHICIIPTPLPTARYDDLPKRHWMKPLRGSLGHVYGLFIEQASQLCRKHGATFLPQPASTITADSFTDEAFSRGSKRLAVADEEHPEQDAIHMNDRYGRLLLQEIEAFAAEPNTHSVRQYAQN